MRGEKVVIVIFVVVVYGCMSESEWYSCPECGYSSFGKGLSVGDDITCSDCGYSFQLGDDWADSK